MDKCLRCEGRFPPLVARIAWSDGTAKLLASMQFGNLCEQCFIEFKAWLRG